MDYYSQATAHYLLTGAEQRKSPRKPLRREVSIGNTCHGIVRGHTLDISKGGLSVMVPMALAINSSCAIRFELFVDGTLLRVAGNGRVVNCSCAGMEGFRVGMKLKVQDPHLQMLLDDFIAK